MQLHIHAKGRHIETKPKFANFPVSLPRQSPPLCIMNCCLTIANILDGFCHVYVPLDEFFRTVNGDGVTYVGQTAVPSLLHSLPLRQIAAYVVQ